MPFSPDPTWYSKIAEAASRDPVFVLSVDGAPAVWSSGPVLPRTTSNVVERLSAVNGANAGLYQIVTVPTTIGRTWVASIWIRGYDIPRWRIGLRAGSEADVISTLYLGPLAGWQRAEIAFTSAIDSGSIIFWIENAGTDVGSVELYGAQIEDRTNQDAVATLYERTSAAAGRKNLLLRSEEFGSSPWVTQGNASVTATNLGPGPDSHFNTSGKPLVAGALTIDSFSGNQIYPGEGRYTVGQMKAMIANDGQHAARWMATERVIGFSPRVFNQFAQLFLGEASMPEDQYQVVWSGYIADASFIDGQSLEIRGFPRVTAWDRDLMVNCDEARGTVKIKEDFASPFDSFFGTSDLSAVDNFYNGWKLKFSSGANEGQEFTVSDYVGISRRFVLSAGATSAIEVKDAFTIYNYVQIVGNPINIWVRLLLGDFSIGGATQTAWPITSVSGTTPTGLSFVPGDLDVAQIQAERDTWIADLAFSLIWAQPEQAKRTFEEQIFRVIDGYPILSQDGLFRFKMSRPGLVTAAPFEIGEHMIEDIPDWTRLTGDLLNRVKIWGDYNPATHEYQVLADKTTRDRRYKPEAIFNTVLLEIKSRGLTSVQGGVVYATARADRALTRFGTGGPEQIKISAGPRLALLEGGERVLVSHSKLPNLATGILGKSKEAFEVVRSNQAADFSTDLTLVGFYPVGRPAFIAPDANAPLYANATDTEKQYAYSSPVIGNFPDSGQPYVII